MANVLFDVRLPKDVKFVDEQHKTAFIKMLSDKGMTYAEYKESLKERPETIKLAPIPAAPESKVEELFADLSYNEALKAHAAQPNNLALGLHLSATADPTETVAHIPSKEMRKESNKVPAADHESRRYFYVSENPGKEERRQIKILLKYGCINATHMSARSIPDGRALSVEECFAEIGEKYRATKHSDEILAFEVAQETEATKQHRAAEYKTEQSKKALRTEFPDMGHEELKVKVPKKHFDIDYSKILNKDFPGPVYLMQNYAYKNYLYERNPKHASRLNWIIDDIVALGWLPADRHSYMLKGFKDHMDLFSEIMKRACPQMLGYSKDEDGNRVYNTDVETKKAFAEAYVRRHGGLKMLLITDQYHDEYPIASRLDDDSIVVVIKKEYGFRESVSERVTCKNGAPGRRVRITKNPYSGKDAKKAMQFKFDIMRPAQYIDKYCSTDDPYAACNNFDGKKIKYRVLSTAMARTKLDHELTSSDKEYLKAQVVNRDTSKLPIANADSGVIWGVDREVAQMDIEYIEAVNKFLAEHPEEEDLFDDIDTRVCHVCGKKMLDKKTEKVQHCPHCDAPFVSNFTVASFGSIALIERIGEDEDGNIIYAESYGDEVDGEILWHDTEDWEDGDPIDYVDNDGIDLEDDIVFDDSGDTDDIADQ